MNALNQPTPEHLLEFAKSDGFGFVFDYGHEFTDEFIEKVIAWANLTYPLGFVDRPISIEIDEEDFGEGVLLELKWDNSIDCLLCDVIEALDSFIAQNCPNSPYKWAQVSCKSGEGMLTH